MAWWVVVWGIWRIEALYRYASLSIDRTGKGQNPHFPKHAKLGHASRSVRSLAEMYSISRGWTSRCRIPPNPLHPPVSVYWGRGMGLGYWGFPGSKDKVSEVVKVKSGVMARDGHYSLGSARMWNSDESEWGMGDGREAWLDGQLLPFLAAAA